MKKIWGIVILTIIALFLTGCGGKKLVCSYDEVLEKEKEEYIFTFKDDKVTKMKSILTFFADSEEEAREYEKEIKESLTEEENLKGTKLSIKRNKKTVIVSLDVDFSKVSSSFEEGWSFLAEFNNLDYDSVKDKFPSYITCK